MYIAVLVIPVPEEKMDAYREWAEKGAAIFKKYGCIEIDYHIMRIKLLFDNLKSKNTSYKFFYHGIPTDYSKFRNIKILYKEVFKLIRTYGFILFWDPEYPTQPPN